MECSIPFNKHKYISALRYLKFFFDDMFGCVNLNYLSKAETYGTGIDFYNK